MGLRYTEVISLNSLKSLATNNWIGAMFSLTREDDAEVSQRERNPSIHMQYVAFVLGKETRYLK